MFITKNERLVLERVRQKSDISGILHLKKEFNHLKTIGLIDCVFDEQGNIIRANITPKGNALF